MLIEAQREDVGSYVQIHGGPDHATHELDVSGEFESLKSPKEVRSRVGGHFKKQLK